VLYIKSYKKICDASNGYLTRGMDFKQNTILTRELTSDVLYVISELIKAQMYRIGGSWLCQL